MTRTGVLAGSLVLAQAYILKETPERSLFSVCASPKTIGSTLLPIAIGSAGTLAHSVRDDLSHGFDVAEDGVKRNRVVALRMAGIGIWQNNESVNSSRSKCFYAALVETTDRCHGDFELAKFRRASMLLCRSSQTLQMLPGLFDSEAEAVPAIAHRDHAAESGWAFAADDDRRSGALNRKRV